MDSNRKRHRNEAEGRPPRRRETDPERQRSRRESPNPRREKRPANKPEAATTREDRRRNRAMLRHKRALRKRVNGKPTHHSGTTGIFHLFGTIIGRSLKIALVIILLIGFLLLGLGSGLLAGYISTASDVEIGDIQHVNEKTRIFDKDGKVIATLTGSSNINREYVPIKEIKNTYMEAAVIAIEDERFETHPGIDPKRIASAILSALANKGSPTHGGSTITQQTIKLVTGADDISAQRKIQEWYNAYNLEKRRSKDGIMELYLNLIPMSNNIVGVQAAAKAYFNKDAKDLTLSECAFLAGIPNTPSANNPLTEYGRRNALRRMRFTLRKMYDIGKITEAEYEEARTQELKFDFSQTTVGSEPIRSYFADYVITRVIDDLVKKAGYTPAMASMAVYNQGLSIETTMDSTVQRRLERVYKDPDLFVKDPSQIPDSPEVPQSSIVVIENSSVDPGRVRGMVGGFGEKKKNLGFNRAVDAKRQPGSSIKPIVVYAPALETEKITAATVFDDHEVFLNPQEPDKPYPKNVYKGYKGKVTFRQALVSSINTVAADLFVNVLYPEVGLDYLKRTGIDRTGENYPATALGGLSKGVSTYEMAGAYSCLANQGVYAEPTVYTRVLKHDGTVLLDNTAPQQSTVYRRTTTFILTDALESVAANINAKPEGMHAAGKTGTTDDNLDKWFCGYTPYYTAAVWYGYDNSNGRRFEIPEVDRNNAIDIWRAAMTAIHEGKEDTEFARPDGIITATVCPVSGQFAGPHCPNPITVYLDEASAANPKGSCTLHKPKPEPPKEIEETTTKPSEKPDEGDGDNEDGGDNEGGDNGD